MEEEEKRLKEEIAGFSARPRRPTRPKMTYMVVTAVETNFPTSLNVERAGLQRSWKEGPLEERRGLKRPKKRPAAKQREKGHPPTRQPKQSPSRRTSAPSPTPSLGS